MNREERAKQFMPFDALKGLKEELKAREERRLKVEKKEVTEERAEELSNAIMKAEKGTSVKITFYENGKYVEKKGLVTAKNAAYKYISVDGKKIFFDDLWTLETGDR